MLARTMKTALACFLIATAFSLPAAGAEFSAAPLSEAFLAQGRADGATRSATPDGKLGYIPSPIDLSHLRRGVDIVAAKGGGSDALAYPRRFDLREAGHVTSAKEQRYNNCWAYSALGALESSYLRAGGERLDLSEMHLSYYAFAEGPGFTGSIHAGGFDNVAVAVLSRWTGAVLEKDLPESAYPPSGAAAGYANRLHLEDAYVLGLQFADGGLPIVRDTVKGLIGDKGAVSVGIYMFADENGRRPYYDEANAAWFYNGPETVPNHAVILVGWDDDFSRRNFREGNRPVADGAWLARNHWGETFGDGGFFWVSYEDLGLRDGVAYVAGETDNFDKHYGHDALGWCNSVGVGEESAWAANVFTAGSVSERLDAVSFYTTANDASYEILVYGDVRDPGNPASGTLRLRQSGSERLCGYHTVRLRESVALAARERFSIVLRMTTPDFPYPVAVETAIQGYSDRASSARGESFFSEDGEAWEDLYDSYNACIKAFTTNDGERPPVGEEAGSDSGSGCRSGAAAASVLFPALCLAAMRRRARV